MKSIVTVEREIQNHTEHECGRCWQLFGETDDDSDCMLYGALKKINYKPLRHQKCKETAREVRE